MSDYVTKVQPAKTEAVDKIKTHFGEINDFILTDYRGLSVAQITELRRKLRETGAEYKVIKNRYAKIALHDLGYDGFDEMLTGPTAVALVKEESAPAVKAIFDFTRESSVKVKGGMVEGSVFTKEQLEMFSKLPSRDDLLAILMGTMKAPVQNLVYVLNEPVQKLARTIKAVADQKEGS